MDESVTAMQMQVVEVARIIQESGDAEMAFQLQLEEALMISASAYASTSSSARGKNKVFDDEASEMDNGINKSGGHKDEDRQVAITQQENEMEKLKKEMENEMEAIKEQDRLTQLYATAEHDFRFSRFLSSLPENEWNKSGNLSDPFTFCRVAPDPTHKASKVEMKGSIDHRMDSASSSSSSSVLCQSDVWEPALAAAFLVDAAENRYLATIKEGFITDRKRIVKLQGSVDTSQDDHSYCSICMEAVMNADNSVVVSDSCKHQFCASCLRKHSETAVKSGKSFIDCPAFRCEELLSAEMCELLLSPNVLLMLTQRQIENVFTESERIYCPFPDCSVLLLKPEVPPQPTSSDHPHQTAVGGVECMSCARYFCFECRVPWHDQLTCEEFQKLPSDERSAEALDLRNLAKLRKWQRCKGCGAMVELKSGCHHITCRCGSQFCYNCGEGWSHGHLCANYLALR